MLAIATTATLTVWPAAAALECEGVALDDGCLFTITGGDTTDPNDGYAVTNAYGVPLWDFVRQRDLQAIGFPHQPALGQRAFHLPGLPEGHPSSGTPATAA